MNYPMKLKKKRFPGINSFKNQNNVIHWYQDFFEKHYLESYKELLNHFDPEEEVNFLLRTMNLPGGSRILDLCGGHGRHSIPLAKKGYEVTPAGSQQKFSGNC